MLLFLFFHFHLYFFLAPAPASPQGVEHLDDETLLEEYQGALKLLLDS